MGSSLQSAHHLDTTKETSEKDGWGTGTRGLGYNSARCLEHSTKFIKPIIWMICYLIWNQRYILLAAACYHPASHYLITRPMCLFPRAQTLQLILARASFWDWQTRSHPAVFFNPPLIASGLCDAYKTAPSKFAVVPIGSPNSSHDASLSKSIALDFVSFYQYGCSHLPPAFLFLFSLWLVWMISRYRSDEVWGWKWRTTLHMNAGMGGQCSGGSGGTSCPFLSLILQLVTKTKGARIWSDNPPPTRFPPQGWDTWDWIRDWER